ncbi:MAG: DNA-directed RNA polymerase subunit P [Methanobrevibacter sp.]|nr:DNA-directed RNA polymerase subunit P [Candidatus Methanovirga aequatorialis]
MYKCNVCGLEIDPKSYMENKCPECRSRILMKMVPEVKRTVSSR